MPKLILLNGPPGVGKDTAALAIEADTRIDPPVFFERFSRPNKEAFAALMNAPIDEYFAVEGYETDKSKIIPLLGVSYRQWQIDFSERFMKPLYGTTIFAKLLLSRIEPYAADPMIFVIPGCGFQTEVDHLAREFPPDDILFFTIQRPGHTFEGDSREYVIPDPNWTFHTIPNSGSKDDFESRILVCVHAFLGTGAPDATT